MEGLSQWERIRCASEQCVGVVLKIVYVDTFSFINLFCLDLLGFTCTNKPNGEFVPCMIKIFIMLFVIFYCNLLCFKTKL